jgi:hypothetical protein
MVRVVERKLVPSPDPPEQAGEELPKYIRYRDTLSTHYFSLRQQLSNWGITAPGFVIWFFKNQGCLFFLQPWDTHGITNRPSSKELGIVEIQLKNHGIMICLFKPIEY